MPPRMLSWKSVSSNNSTRCDGDWIMQMSMRLGRDFEKFEVENRKFYTVMMHLYV